MGPIRPPFGPRAPASIRLTPNSHSLASEEPMTNPHPSIEGFGCRNRMQGLIGPKRGSNRAQKFRRFLGFFPYFNGILMPILGFNYSKMPSSGPRSYPNTFLMILGTSKILSKSGPVTLPIIINLL